jgi:hypothetical protein
MKITWNILLVIVALFEGCVGYYSYTIINSNSKTLTLSQNGINLEINGGYYNDLKNYTVIKLKIFNNGKGIVQFNYHEFNLYSKNYGISKVNNDSIFSVYPSNQCELLINFSGYDKNSNIKAEISEQDTIVLELADFVVNDAITKFENIKFIDENDNGK